MICENYLVYERKANRKSLQIKSKYENYRSKRTFFIPIEQWGIAGVIFHCVEKKEIIAVIGLHAIKIKFSVEYTLDGFLKQAFGEEFIRL